jgi:ABC-type polysaccharide/polyol phosphate export permease
VRFLLDSLSKNRRLLADLVRRDLRSRYIGSTMGLFWSVVFPVINLAVYMFVFRFVFKTRWSDKQDNTDVALLMLTGIMTWHAFSESLIRMTSSLVDNSNLIQKVVFPSEVLPVSLTISSLVNMLIGVGVAIAAVVYFAYLRPHPAATVGPPRPVAFGVHVGGEGTAAPPLTTACPFHCASFAESTRYSPYSVDDQTSEGWKQTFGGRSGVVLNAGWGDRVYAATGEWTRVKSKNGLVLRIEGWRDRSGNAVAPPKDGTPALVVGPPERQLGLSISLLAIPLLVAVQGVFMLGLGMLLAAFNLYVRDTVHLIGVFLTVWMFGTPIFYPERMVRDAGYGWLPAYNPMNWLISCYREVLVYGDWPNPMMLGRFALVAAATLVLGATFFMHHKPKFPDLL